jgi:hypothetical protein
MRIFTQVAFRLKSGQKYGFSANVMLDGNVTSSDFVLNEIELRSTIMNTTQALIGIKIYKKYRKKENVSLLCNFINGNKR